MAKITVLCNHENKLLYCKTDCRHGKNHKPVSIDSRSEINAFGV